MPPSQQVTYSEALDLYGTDKPDLRYELRLRELTDLCRGCGFRIFERAVESDGMVKALRLPGAADALSRKDLDGLLKGKEDDVLDSLGGLFGGKKKDDDEKK